MTAKIILQSNDILTQGTIAAANIHKVPEGGIFIDQTKVQKFTDKVTGQVIFLREKTAHLLHHFSHQVLEDPVSQRILGLKIVGNQCLVDVCSRTDILIGCSIKAPAVKQLFAGTDDFGLSVQTVFVMSHRIPLPGQIFHIIP